MKICLIDDKLNEWSGANEIVVSLLEKYEDNFELFDNFFPECFKDGYVIEENSRVILDQYDAIIYHITSFEGRAEAFIDIAGQMSCNCEFVGFSGELIDRDSFPDEHLICVPRTVLYRGLEAFIKKAIDDNKVDSKNILNA